MDQPVIARAILATFLYYKPLRLYAFTPLELMRYLTLAPQNKTQQSQPRVSLRETLEALNGLAQQKKIAQTNGYFFLAQSGQDAYWQRIRARKTSVEKRRVFRQIARFYPYIPYVRMVALTGSVARDSATSDSDIDILIASAPKRIWLTRLLVGTFTWFLGKYRHRTLICDKICLNHYISLGDGLADGNASLSPEILSTAHIYAAAAPYWGAANFTKIGRTNKWMASYISLVNDNRISALDFRPTRLLLLAKTIIELLADSFGVGTVLERGARYLQKTRILRGIDEKQLEPVRMIVSDSTLLFHYPFSRSKLLEDHFYSAVRELVSSE